jgi:signal peptidase I
MGSDKMSNNVFVKIFGKTIYWLILAFLVFVAGFTALTVFNLPSNYKMFVVMSGSMEPKIKTGSIVVVKQVNNYVKGDVITFKESNNPKITVTHRIFSLKEENNIKVFTTKGDANKSPDLAEIRQGQILGKEILAIPYIGYVINFAKTQTGLMVLIVIPAVIIVYNELMNIKKEALRLIKERKERKLTTKEKIEEKIGEEEIKAENWLKRLIRKIRRNK